VLARKRIGVGLFACRQAYTLQLPIGLGARIRSRVC